MILVSAGVSAFDAKVIGLLFWKRAARKPLIDVSTCRTTGSFLSYYARIVVVHINDFTFSKAFECDGFHAKSMFSFKRFLKGALWSARLGMNELI